MGRDSYGPSCPEPSVYGENLWGKKIGEFTNVQKFLFSRINVLCLLRLHRAWLY